MQNPTMRVELADVFKTNFSVFDGYDGPVKAEQIIKLNYIDMIANQLEKNLQGVNLFDILPNNNNIILANEGEINNILIAFDREKYFGKPEPEHVVVKMSPEQIESIEKIFVSQFEDRKRGLQRDADNSVSNAARRMRDYHSYLNEAASYRQQIEAIKMADAKPLIESLEQVFKDERLRFLQFRTNAVQNDTIEFVIKDDIINTYKNEKAGINLRVNLGKLKIRVTFRRGLKIKVWRHENNLSYQDHYHPHLGTDGDVCLGSMNEIYSECMENGDIHGMINTVMQVLLNYNDGDPYRPLVKFAEISKQIQPNGEQIERDRTPRNQYVQCSECDNEWEEEFAPSGESDYIEVDCPECDTYNEFEYYYEN